MKKTLKENSICFASAILAGLFFLFVCFYFKIYPFGTDYCLLFSDMAQQYAPLMTHLHDIVNGGKDLLYSWSAGLGYSFLGNYLNYLASPFTYIILFFTRENVVHAINIIILLKSMMIAGCFSYFLKKSYSFKGAFNIIPSLLYTFSGWFVAYYWNIMWLDSLFCLPLAVLGLQRIIEKKKPWLYLFTLSYAMLTNYYTAYMLCIFMCVYFIYYYFLKNEIKKDFQSGFFKSNLLRSGVMFAGFSVTAVLISAVALIPVFFCLRSSSAVTDSFPKNIEYLFNPLYFLVRQFSGSTPIVQTTGDPDIPNCWTGLMTVVLIPVYFLSKTFSKKERILDALLLGFMFLNIGLNISAFVWCGFHYPNGLADRFACFYIFVAVALMSKVLNNIANIKKSLVISAVSVAGAFIILMRIFAEAHTEKYAVIISLGFLAVWLALYLISGIKKIDRSLLKLLVVVIVCLEMIFSQLENFDFNYYRGDFDRDSVEFRSTYSIVKENDGELFFRTEATDIQSYMYPMLMGYNGISNFSSMSSYNIAKSQCALGIDSNTINSTLYFLQTPVYNSVFGIKYLIGFGGSLQNNEFFTEEIKNGEFSAFKNNYYLPLGFCVNENAKDIEGSVGDNPFYSQNELFKNFSGVGNVFECCSADGVKADSISLSVKSEDTERYIKTYSVELNDGAEEGFITFSFTLPENNEYYFYISHNRRQKGAEVKTDGEEYPYLKMLSNFYLEPNAVMPLGEREKGETLTVKLPVNEQTEGKDVSVYVAAFNKERFIEGYNRLKDNVLTLTEFENTHFKGTVTADEDCLLFTSIPYDKGWHITLDGKDVPEEDVIAIDGAYISVPLTKGEHTVEFNYFPVGLKAGAVVSSLTAAGLAAYLIIDRRRKKNQI